MERVVQILEQKMPAQPKATRVAAYARVSSGKDAMLHSLSAQISYYSEMIQNHGGWLYCGVFSDEAITGTKEDRPGFQSLMAQCRAGNIDLVITKSISRFARNTVTLLETTRELKDLGVDVFFEEQNIHTMSADGELMMTILASYAQEESRSASENMKWRVKRNFQEGHPWNGTILGYRIKDCEYVPQRDEAQIVRLIFDYYLAGYGYYAIAKKLNAAGYHTRHGNIWSYASVEKLIRQYSYTGNLLLQTTFITNHITKKKELNRGQRPLYHAEGTHEPIISLEEYNTVQAERKQRSEHFGSPSGKKQKYPFTGKLECCGCGHNYRRKKVANGHVWICSTFNTRGKAYCPTSKQIPEAILESTAARVLDLTAFDPQIFEAKILKIMVDQGNALRFIFWDGHTIDTTWADRSRADSWTAERRAAARNKENQRRSEPWHEPSEQ